MKWSLGKWSSKEILTTTKFANVVCGAPRELSESGQPGGCQNCFPVADLWLIVWGGRVT